MVRLLQLCCILIRSIFAILKMLSHHVIRRNEPENREYITLQKPCDQCTFLKSPRTEIVQNKMQVHFKVIQCLSSLIFSGGKSTKLCTSKICPKVHNAARKLNKS